MKRAVGNRQSGNRQSCHTAECPDCRLPPLRSRIRLVSWRIEDPDVEGGQCGERVVWESADVRRVCEAAEAEAERFDLAVDLPERMDFDRPPGAFDHERDTGGDVVVLQDRRIIAARRRTEAVRKTLVE